MRIRNMVGMLAVLAVAACGGNAPPTSTVSSHRAYVLIHAPTSTFVAPFDLTSGDRGVAIPMGLGASPISIALAPSRHTAYVGTSLENEKAVNANGTIGGNIGSTVVPIDLNSNTPSAPIPINLPAITVASGVTIFSQGVIAIAITPDAKTAYALTVTEYDTPSPNVMGSDISYISALTPISLTTGHPLAPILITGPSSTFALSKDGQTAYLLTDTGIIPIDLKTSKQSPSIGIATNQIGTVAIAIAPDGKSAYVTDNWDRTLIPINLAGAKSGPPISLGVDGTFRFSSVTISQTGKNAYITGNSVGTGMVISVDLATQAAYPAIGLGASSTPSALVITPDRKTAYVADSARGAIVPIDLATSIVESPLFFHNQEQPFAIVLIS
jgi:DNA-binding beta-propeller fold protein YncE